MRQPVVEYERLLHEIHRLIDRGEGDSEEAEELAEQMDAPWLAMTADEQSQMRELAARLNNLRD